jgi:hypothetical protein
MRDFFAEKFWKTKIFAQKVFSVEKRMIVAGEEQYTAAGF